MASLIETKNTFRFQFSSKSMAKMRAHMKSKNKAGHKLKTHHKLQNKKSAEKSEIPP